MSADDVIFIPAIRCKRCGGLLISDKSIKDGYGHVCKMAIRREEMEREMDKDQCSMFQNEEGEQ